MPLAHTPRPSSGPGARRRIPGLALIVVVAMGVGLAAAAASALPSCTDTFTGPSGGDWATASNWSAGHPPGGNDVACWSAGTNVVVSSGNQATESMQGGDLTITGGSLMLNGPDDSTLIDFSESGGYIQTSPQNPGNILDSGGASNVLHLTGNFSWTGGELGTEPGSLHYYPIAISQTGGGSCSITGTAVAFLHLDSELSTTSPVTISNPNLEGNLGEIHTSSTVNFAPGTYANLAGPYNNESPVIYAAGFVTTGTTTLPGYDLVLQGNLSSLGGSLTVYGLETDPGSTLTVPGGIDLTAEGSTGAGGTGPGGSGPVAGIQGTVTGPGTFTIDGHGRVYDEINVNAGGALTTDHVRMSNGSLVVYGTYDAAVATTIDAFGELALAASASASTGDYVQSGGSLDAPLTAPGGTLAVAGKLDFQGGLIALPITQTGGGECHLTGTTSAQISGGSITTTTTSVLITDLHVIGGPGSITTPGTITLAPGSYDENPGQLLRLNAAGFVTSGAVTGPSFDLHLTGDASSVGASLSVAGLSTDVGTTLTVPSGDTLTSGHGTISGTVTGPGAFTQGQYTTSYTIQLGPPPAYTPATTTQTYGGTTEVAAGGTLSTTDVVVPAQVVPADTTDQDGNHFDYVAAGTTLKIDAGATYAASGETSVSGDELDIASRTAATGGYHQTGGRLNGPGTLTDSGGFSWAGGAISPSQPISLTQTGGGSFSIEGSGSPAFDGGALSTSSPVWITNPNFVTAHQTGSSTSLATTSTLNFGDGLVVPANGGDSATFTAAGLGPNAGPSYGLAADALLLTGGASTVATGNTLDAGPLTLQGGTLQDDGTVAPGSATITGGTLKGAGVIGSAVTNTSGTVAPGDSPGMLTVNGDYSQGSGATLAIAVNSASPGGYSMLHVKGNVHLAGTLAMQPAVGYVAAAAPGDTLGVLPYTGSLSGSFAAVTTSPPTVQGSFSADYAHPSVVDAVLRSSTAHPTSTSVSCAPGSVSPGNATSCTATVSDTAPAAPSTPGGTVAVSSDSSGSFAGSPCTLSGSGTSATCTVSYTPGGVGSGTHTITAVYSGDGQHQASSGHTAVTVTPSSGGAGGGGGFVLLAPPTVDQSCSARDVSFTSATLSASINPSGQSTTYHFEYGLSTAYGSSTAEEPTGSDSQDHQVTSAVSGLRPGSTYHCRVVAMNGSGTAKGADQTFTTPPSPAGQSGSSAGGSGGSSSAGGSSTGASGGNSGGASGGNSGGRESGGGAGRPRLRAAARLHLKPLFARASRHGCRAELNAAITAAVRDQGCTTALITFSGTITHRADGQPITIALRATIRGHHLLVTAHAQASQGRFQVTIALPARQTDASHQPGADHAPGDHWRYTITYHGNSQLRPGTVTGRFTLEAEPS